MLADAAHAHWLNDYRQSLRSQGERVTAERFHEELRSSAADLILDSLRDRFDTAAEQITRTRSVISAESTLEHIVESAQSGDNTIELWQQLTGHIKIVEAIRAIASQFGARPTAAFPLIAEVPGDNFRTDDRALVLL